MSVLNPRKRLVNFRLSDVEFTRLKTACGEQGARSISDFARTSVLHSIDVPHEAAQTPASRVSSLDQKVAELEIRLSQLLSLMSGGGLPSSSNNGRSRLLPESSELQRY